MVRQKPLTAATAAVAAAPLETAARVVAPSEAAARVVATLEAAALAAAPSEAALTVVATAEAADVAEAAGVVVAAGTAAVSMGLVVVAADTCSHMMLPGDGTCQLLPCSSSGLRSRCLLAPCTSFRR